MAAEPPPALLFVNVSCGVPVISTASLNLTLTSTFPPALFPSDVVTKSIDVISAAPKEVAKSPIATRTSGSASGLSFPLSLVPGFNSHPLWLADAEFFYSSVRFLGLSSTASVAPHSPISFSY